MSEPVDVRPYEPGDETSILELFQLVFGRPMSMAFWRWRFLENPVKKQFVELAWQDGTLVAHYATSPATVRFNGQDYLAALSMTTMTHSDFRGRGLFGTLAERVYESMAEAGAVLVWGFPNRLSHRGLVRVLQWTDIHEIPTFRRALNEGDPLPPPPNAVQRLEGPDRLFDALWDELKDRYPVLTRRDRTYLDWRFARHPENDYRFLGYLDKDRLRGYAVFKDYGDEVDLVDLLSVSDDVASDLVLGVARYGRERGTTALNLWLNLTLPLHWHLEKWGFENAPPTTYFGGRLLSSDPMLRMAYQYGNWYVTMGDSDVY